MSFLKDPTGLLAMVSLSYLGVLWVGTSTQTVDPINTRYAMVVYPCLSIVLFRLLLSLGREIRSITQTTFILLLTVFCVGLNVRSINKITSKLYPIEKPVHVLRWINKNVKEKDIILSTSHYLGYWLDRQCFYLPRPMWHGFFFAKKDALLCARASKRVWMTVVKEDMAGAEEGLWGPFVRRMLLNQEARFYRKIATLEDGEIFVFDAR